MFGSRNVNESFHNIWRRPLLGPPSCQESQFQALMVFKCPFSLVSGSLIGLVSKDIVKALSRNFVDTSISV